MEIIDKIEAFLSDIYFKLPKQLNDDYISICEDISAFFEKYFIKYADVMEQEKEILQYLFDILQTGDYIKMSDALFYEVRPILNDALILIEKDKLNIGRL